MLENIFHLKENHTDVKTELMAGVTTFMTMAYILAVNPSILSASGMDANAVLIATSLASFVGTALMALLANYPFALAPGMGLNAYFSYTVVLTMGYSWQLALMAVFVEGIIFIVLSLTNVREAIFNAIPMTLKSAVSVGIGLFVAYVGFLNVGFFTFTTKADAKNGDAVQATPGLAVMNNPTIWLFIIGLVLAIVLTVLKVRGGMLIAIAVTAVVGIPMGQTTMANSVSIADTFAQLPQTFGVIFTKDGFPALFSDVSKLPIILLTIFAFSMSDTFDTIGTFIGTGRRTGIFSAEDEKALENGSGFSSKMDKALFADSIATSIGAICGTSNTTTYVESSAGIAAGGRTGLTSVVVAICFALSAFLSPVISAVPSAATAGVLVVVGCMMASSLKEIEWGDISEAVPAFFASVFMAFSYSISYGIAGGFITYCLIKTCKGKAKEVHPVIWVVSLLFILDFIITAIL